MKVDFTRGKISCRPQDALLPLKKKRKAYWIITLVVLIIFPAYTSFAQAPSLTGIEAAALNYDEGQAPTQITSSLTVSDPDSPLLTSATIQITGNYSSTEDLLQFTDAFSITGSFESLTGTLTLTGPASPADFTNALKAITYQNTNGDHPSNLIRTVSFTVNDGTSNSITVNRTIQVIRINDAPIGQPDNFVMYEDTELDCGCLLINDVDPDGDHLIALLAEPPANGTVVDQGGFFIYIPHQDFYGTDSFTYYANDGQQNSSPTLVTITILPVNDAPIAFDDAISTNEDTPVNIPILSNDIDVDDILVASMIVVVDGPSQGTLAINTTTGTVIYTPNLDYNGGDSFTYQVKDASDALSNIATVNITINPVNDAPVANADFATTPEEIPVSIQVLGNDTDVDNMPETSSLSVVNGPANGSAVVQPSTGTILYTPQKDFTGSDSFTYTVTDADGATSAPATVTVTVTPVNDPPVAVDDQATTDENTVVDIPILSNDYDVDGEVIKSSIIITTIPIHGVVTVNGTTGVVSYAPENGFVGNDSFAYTIDDAGGLTSLPATVSVNVIDVPNRAPNAVDDGPILNSSLAPITIDVLANDYDEDHDEISLVSVTNPSMGTVTIVNGKIEYQAAGLTSGTVTFTYTIQDPSGLTDEAVVTIENSFPPLTVSEGFSPNNDSNNETWYILGIEYYPNNSVKVYDRWGFLVYQKQHYENIAAPWNGRGNVDQHAGKLLDQGTYYYILEPGDDLKTMTGYVVIVR
jgi:gliding motility-associated-like protein